MLRRVIAIAGKEFQLFIRDPSALALTFLMPLMFIVVMSVAVGRLFGNEEGQPLSIVAVNQDRGDLAARAVDQLSRIDGLAVSSQWQGRPIDEERARQLVTAGELGAALVFPPTFSRSLSLPPDQVAPEEEIVQLVVDPALSLQYVDPIHATVTGLIREAAFVTVAPAMLETWCPQARASSPPTETTGLAQTVLARLGSRARVERQYTTAGQGRVLPNSYQQNVPGYTIFGVFWIVALLSGSIVRERREGTFRRLKAAPLHRWTVLAGKLLPYLAINVVQIASMLAVGHLVFAMELGNSPLALVLVSLAAAVTATSLGTLVASVVRTEAQAGSLSTTVLLALSALGGCFVPRFIMPPWLRACGWLTPHAWALEAYQDLLVRGGGLVQVLPHLGVLAGFAALFFAAGTWRFRLD
jgi:ABC-2 type transport system permease protein